MARSKADEEDEPAAKVTEEEAATGEVAVDEDIVTAETPEEQEAAAQQDRDQADARPLSGSEGGQAPPKEEAEPK